MKTTTSTYQEAADFLAGLIPDMPQTAIILGSGLAALAARVPAPLFYADNPNSKRLRAKTNIILKRMGSAELPEE